MLVICFNKLESMLKTLKQPRQVWLELCGVLIRTHGLFVLAVIVVLQPKGDPDQDPQLPIWRTT